MLIRFEGHSPQVVLGQDWFSLFQVSMAGHSVYIGPTKIRRNRNPQNND